MWWLARRRDVNSQRPGAFSTPHRICHRAKYTIIAINSLLHRAASVAQGCAIVPRREWGKLLPPPLPRGCHSSAHYGCTVELRPTPPGGVPKNVFPTLRCHCATHCYTRTIRCVLLALTVVARCSCSPDVAYISFSSHTAAVYCTGVAHHNRVSPCTQQWPDNESLFRPISGDEGVETLVAITPRRSFALRSISKHVSAVCALMER